MNICTYRDRLKCLYVVARSLFLLLLTYSAWSYLGPVQQDLHFFLADICTSGFKNHLLCSSPRISPMSLETRLRLLSRPEMPYPRSRGREEQHQNCTAELRVEDLLLGLWTMQHQSLYNGAEMESTAPGLNLGWRDAGIRWQTHQRTMSLRRNRIGIETP